MRSIFALAFLLVSVYSYTVSYEGYKVYSVTPTKEQLPILHELEISGKYDFWTPVRFDLHPVDIMVSPQEQPEFVAWLDAEHFKWVVSIENVQALIDEESAGLPKMWKGLLKLKLKM